MKISFPNYGSGASVSIRAVINALFTRHKTERGHTAHRKENVPQITSEWDYRPKGAIRRYAAIDAVGAEIVDTTRSSPCAAAGDNVIWFDSIDTNPAAEDARKKTPLSDHEYAVSRYD
jgi:hypothetical protein